MKKLLLIMTFALAMSCIFLTGCGGEDVDYQSVREVNWEGTELTISLGTNKSTGCEWTTKSQDDKIIDYSIHRVFHLSDQGASDGEAIGVLDAGFEGKGAGTTQIICTTPVGWDGTGEGYTYTVTVTVNEDGTIESASGE